MKYIDTHCHLDFKDYDSDRGGVFERMVERGVGAITIGTDLESSKKAVEIAEQNENVWACIGVHPNETSPRPASLSDPLLEAGEGRWDEVEFEKLVQSPKVVGIGECGLDFFRISRENLEEEKVRQEKLFKSQIEFALKHNKALMLHCREAYDEVLDILESYKKEAGGKLKGNAHFFAGNILQAKRFLDLGFTLSFTGVVTFTKDYDEVIKYLPSHSIMSETDAPFVSPVPYRGKRNEPSFVVEVVKKLAEIRGESEEKIAKSIIHTAQKVFGVTVS